MSVVIAVQMGLEIWQVDFVSAYLNSVLDFDVYMEVLQGLSAGEDMCCLLLKTLYRLMQGGHDWWHTLNRAYQELGYETSRADSCVRTRRIGDEHTITNTFNDDVFSISSTFQGARDAKCELAAIYDVKDLGTPSFILGMAIERNPTTGAISLSQKA